MYYSVSLFIVINSSQTPRCEIIVYSKVFFAYQMLMQKHYYTRISKGEAPICHSIEKKNTQFHFRNSLALQI